MAEIHIEKKRRPVWPWILGLLVLVGLVWVIIEASDRDKETVSYKEDYTSEGVYIGPEGQGMQRDELGMTPGDTSTVSREKTQAFLTYVNEAEFEEGMGVDHQVTAEGLMKLSEAIQEVSDNSQTETINKINETAQQIQQNPESLQHANHIREAVSGATKALKEIQKNQFPELQGQVNEVESAANSIKADQQLLNQKEQVKEFFEKAASALNEMSEVETEQEPS